MTKRGFITLLLALFGVFCWITAILMMCEFKGVWFWIGLGALVVGLASIIMSILVGKNIFKKFKYNKRKFWSIFAVILTTLALYALGIVLLSVCGWAFGYFFIPLGFLNLLFIVPIRGFKKENEENENQGK